MRAYWRRKCELDMPLSILQVVLFDNGAPAITDENTITIHENGDTPPEPMGLSIEEVIIPLRRTDNESQ